MLSRVEILMPAIVAALVLSISPAAAQETGELESLRSEALSLVNNARSQHALDPLELGESLNQAAQAHAEDMLESDYYSHVSPEGETVKDRYLDHGGNRWKLVAENIATCDGCPTTPTVERVRSFQEGWMNSPPHRENILKEGLESFGFGIVGGGSGRIYAVQTFAGPGTPAGLQTGEEPVVLSPDELPEEAVRVVNRQRERDGLARFETSEALNQVASQLLPSNGPEGQLIDRRDDLFSLLPDDQAGRWRKLNVLAAGCGGCGSTATAADVRHFADQWLNNPQNERTLLAANLSHLGFAMHVDGAGRKVAVAVAGQRR